MKNSQESKLRELTTTEAPRTEKESTRRTLRLQELESRLAPQSTAAILE